MISIFYLKSLLSINKVLRTAISNKDIETIKAMAISFP